MPPAARLVLRGRAEYARPDGDGALALPQMSCVKHIVVDQDGCQHVLIRANGGVLQLEISGVDVIASSVAITFLVRGVRELGQIAENLSTLRRILAERHPQASEAAHWTPRTRNLRDGLITFDARTAGASDRDVAEFLYGRKAAISDWRTGAFRERMRRNRQRGEWFVKGGYRRLLM